jgi:hypothetical protein
MKLCAISKKYFGGIGCLHLQDGRHPENSNLQNHCCENLNLTQVIKRSNSAFLFSSSVNSKMPIDTDMTLQTIGKNQHVVLKNTKATVTPSRVHLYLSNLFNGDKLLGKSVLAKYEGG